jgi:hypothetical protein
LRIRPLAFALAAGGLVLIGAAFRLSERSAPLPPPSLHNAFAPAVPGPAAFGWRLTAAMSAHRALVLEVESCRRRDAVAIAQQLTELFKDRFDEVLVFFYEPGVSPRRAGLRVQWTRTHGYRTLVLREAARQP